MTSVPGAPSTKTRISRSLVFIGCSLSNSIGVKMNISQSEGNETDFFDEGQIPLQFHSFQMILHPIAFIICVPMNLIVAYVIIADRSLHYARNATWLGVIISNLMVFFMISLQYFIFVERSYTACRMVTFMYGKPYVILLVNIFLATCDRIIYTKWPLFHQRHVTVPRVVAVQLVCSTGAFLGLSFHFLSGMSPIRCGLDPQNVKLAIGTMAVVTFVSIVAKLIVYFMAMKSNSSGRRGVVKREKIIEERSNVFVKEIHRPHLRKHCGSHKYRQEEWNATMTLVANFIPMVLFASLSYLYMLVKLLCHTFYDSCEVYKWLEIFFREIVVFHASTNLLVYIFRSLEFRAAFFKLFPNFCKG